MAADRKLVYSVGEYLENLGRSLENELSFVGMLEAGESQDTLRFAHPSSCDHWVDLPSEHVEHIEHLGTVACKGHRHAVARIKFVDTDEQSPLGAFLKLAKLHHDIAARASISSASGCTPCYDPARGWHCC